MINDKDMVELSTLHAYAKHEVNDEFKVNGNNYVVEEIYNEKRGMIFGTDAMLIKNDSEEYALIFTGSDKRNDFMNDWLVNNGGNLLKFNVPQYSEGNILYQQLSKEYDISRVGGVSLGGGVATYVGINNAEVDVVSINPSPQLITTNKEYSNIKTIIDEKDILFSASMAFGRRNNFTKDIIFVGRGNDYFSNIKFNHIGYDKEQKLYLDDVIPFDLLTGNVNSSLIDVNKADIFTLNDNFKMYFDNIAKEASIGVTPELKIAINDIKDNVSFQRIMINIIDKVNAYLMKSLPTLYSYLDLTFIFEELKSLTDTKLFVILTEIIENLIVKLNLNKINNQIKTDSVHALSNLDKLDDHVNNTANSCKQLIDNINSRDLYMQSASTPILYNYKLDYNSDSINLKYAFLLEKAKEVLYQSLKSTINSKMTPIELKIDTTISFIKTQLGIIGDVTSLISKEIAKKIRILEIILEELYNLDLVETVYNVFYISIDEIVSIVLCKDIDKKVASFKYLSGLMQNSFVVYDNYEQYLLKYNSLGLKSIDNLMKDFKVNFSTYNNYLSKTYN